MPIVILLLTTWMLVLLHVSIMAIAGHLLGVVIREVSYGTGPVLLARGPVRVKLLPLQGYVQFKDTRTENADAADAGTPDPTGAFNHKPLAVQLIVTLAGPLVMIALAIALRPASGPRSVANAVAQLIQGGLGPLSTAQRLLDGAYGMAASQGFVVIAGVLAAKIAVFNLLPLPMINGGQALLILLRGGNPTLPRWQDSLVKIMVFPGLLFALSWAVAVGYFVVRRLSG